MKMKHEERETRAKKYNKIKKPPLEQILTYYNSSGIVLKEYEYTAFMGSSESFKYLGLLSDCLLLGPTW